VVSIGTGRIDATAAGPVGVPQPGDGAFQFQNEFARMGFSIPQMIQMVACGHTMGGVHAVNFPTIVIPGSVPPNDYQLMDSTFAFDNKIAVEYIVGNGSDALVKGPCTKAQNCADLAVFTSDNNVTISQMQDPTVFANTCQTVLQQMTELVPAGVTLTAPISIYEVKPSFLQLSVNPGGNSLTFSGEIRVRTTYSGVNSVTLVYLDRNGASSCGACTITTGLNGTAAGFDDTFSVSFYIDILRNRLTFCSSSDSPRKYQLPRPSLPSRSL